MRVEVEAACWDDKMGDVLQIRVGLPEVGPELIATPTLPLLKDRDGRIGWRETPVFSA
jgi:hypothetical protein